MPITRRTASVLLVVVLWVVAGPIAMAFDACAMMGAMCEAPCGVLSYTTAPPVVAVAALEPLATVSSRQPDRLIAVSASPLEPPPKSALLSA